MPQSPSFKKRVKAQQDEAIKIHQKEHLKLFSDFNTTFCTPEGKRVLSWIMKECGYQESDAIVNPETLELAALSTASNSIRRGLYLQMRKYLKPDILIDVEIVGTADLLD